MSRVILTHPGSVTLCPNFTFFLFVFTHLNDQIYDDTASLAKCKEKTTIKNDCSAADKKSGLKKPSYYDFNLSTAQGRSFFIISPHSLVIILT